MPAKPENPETPKVDEAEPSKISETDRKRMSRIADEAAGKARKTSERYDQQHGTFPRGGPSGVS